MKSKIYISLDSNQINDAIEIIKEHNELIDGVVCGNSLIYGYGILAIKMLDKYTKSIDLIADAKMPVYIFEQCKDMFFESGADGISITGNDEDINSNYNLDYSKANLIVDQTLTVKTIDLLRIRNIKRVFYNRDYNNLTVDKRKITSLSDAGIEILLDINDIRDYKQWKGIKIAAFIISSNQKDFPKLLESLREEIDNKEL